MRDLRRSGKPYIEAWKLRFSRKESSGNKAGVWGRYPIAARWLDVSSVDGVPNTETVPLVGVSRPVINRTVVVLPHPLGPIRPRIRPRSTVRSSGRITSRSPNVLVTCSATTSGPSSPTE